MAIILVRLTLVAVLLLLSSLPPPKVTLKLVNRTGHYPVYVQLDRLSLPNKHYETCLMSDGIAELKVARGSYRLQLVYIDIPPTFIPRTIAEFPIRTSRKLIFLPATTGTCPPFYVLKVGYNKFRYYYPIDCEGGTKE